MRKEVTLVIPAFNEAGTIGAIIETAVASNLFAEVLVVDDGSTDATAELARQAGATVISLGGNQGKAAAMWQGLISVNTFLVMFWDADLIGTSSKHFKALISLMSSRYTNQMIIGVVPGLSQRLVSAWSGQRITRCAVVREFFACHQHLKGFSVDSQLTNWAIEKGVRIEYVPLSHIKHLKKIAKRGWLKGIIQYLKMWGQVLWRQ